MRSINQSATFLFSVRQHNLLWVAICRGCGKTTWRESLFKHLPCLPTSFKHLPHSLSLLPQPTKCFTFVQYFVSVFVEINLNTLTYNIHTTHHTAHSLQPTNAAVRPQNGDCPLFTLNKLSVVDRLFQNFIKHVTLSTEYRVTSGLFVSR